MDEESTRLYLHSKLEELFPGLPIYYRPPGDLLLTRPCVIYQPTEPRPSYANSKPYTIGMLYEVILLIDLPNSFPNRNSIFSMEGVVVMSARTYVEEDVSHDHFTISVNSI